MKLSVYTQNAFGIPLYGTGGRLKKIAAKISELSPDVVFLQEIQWRGHVPLFEHANYDLFHSPGLYATAGGLLTMVKKEFEGEAKFTKYHAQGGLKQLADRFLGKGILDVVVPKNNLHLINTHLMSTYSNRFIRDLRQLVQIEELLAYTNPIPLLIGAGDLNFNEGCEFYDVLKTGFEDFTFGLGNSHEMTKMKLDFVFGKGEIKALKKEYVHYPNFVSDHKGILVEFEV